MAPKVHEVSREQLTDRKADLLAQLGLTEAELFERAAAYSLTSEEWAVFTRIEDVDFLLGA